MKFGGTKPFANTHAHALRDYYGNMHTLINNIVTSVFVKVYSKVHRKFFLFFLTNAKKNLVPNRDFRKIKISVRFGNG